MSEKQSTGSANAAGGIRNAQFLGWVEQFRLKHTHVDDPDSETKQSRVPLYTILEPIKGMKVWIKDVTCLEMNLLYACYQAAHSKPPESYTTSMARIEWNKLKLSLQSQQKYVDGLRTFALRHPATVTKCFAKAKRMVRDGKHTVDAPAQDKTDMLCVLLEEYSFGLKKELKNSMAMGVDAKFGFGPFAYDKDAEDIEKRENPDVITLGLCFHLVYLFRYFTANSAPQNSNEMFVIQPEFFGDELKIRGAMLDNWGSPNYRIVAALVNATFKTKYSTDAIKLRIKDLLRPPKTAKSTPISPKRHIDFVGWEVVVKP